jgi:hypothetical protein
MRPKGRKPAKNAAEALRALREGRFLLGRRDAVLEHVMYALEYVLQRMKKDEDGDKLADSAFDSTFNGTPGAQ